MIRKLSLLSFALTISAILVNIFKQELFGYVVGYAAHEIQFTFAILSPVFAVNFVVAKIVFVKWLWFSIPEKKQYWIDLIIALPGLILGGFYTALTLVLLLSG